MDIEREQRRFRTAKPSRLGRGIERLTNPFGKAIAGMIPKRAVEAVLKGLDRAVGMPQLVPATIGIALRTIRDTGRAYGYDGEGPAEKLFRLQILELAALDDPEQRSRSIADLEAAIGPDGTLVDAEHEQIVPMVDQAVERISRAIAFASFRSRAGMVVPLVGSVVGGIVNSSFQNDVGKAARFAFQARRLKQAAD